MQGAGQAGAACGLDVDGLVTDQPGHAQIQIQIGRRPQDHPGIRLSRRVIGMQKLALAVGMVRAGINGVEPGALRLEQRDDRLLHGYEIVPAITAPADTRLVGHQCYRNAQPVRGADHVGGPGYDGDIFDPAKVVDLFNNDSIAIKEQRRAAAGCVVADFAPDAFRSIDCASDRGNAGAASSQQLAKAVVKEHAWRHGRFRPRR